MRQGRPFYASSSERAKRFASILSVLMFMAGPVLQTIPAVSADASDWGEQVGNVMLQTRWGYGSADNISLSSMELKAGTFKLTTTAGSVNMSAEQMRAGPKTNISMTRADKLTLASTGPTWQRKASWDIPLTAGNSMPRFVDIDNDGDLDSLISNDAGNLIGYNNTGTKFSPTWTLQGAWNKTAIASSFAVDTFGDLDNDGDYDMLAGDNLGMSLAWNNTGNKTWPQWTAKAAWDVPNVGAGAAPYLGDLDADGDLDLVVGENSGTCVAFNNTGTKASPTWTAKTAWDIPTVNSVPTPSLGDLDGDGDLDVVIGRFIGDSRAFRNTGTRTSPAWTREANWDLPDVGKFGAPDLADLDGDGDLDVMIGSDVGNNEAYEHIATYYSTGTFLSPALDAGETVNWSKAKWGESLPANTNVTLYARSGNSTNPNDGTWGAWSAALSNPTGSDLGVAASRRIQIRAVLDSTSTSVTPLLWGINVTYWHYLSPGSAATSDASPGGLIRWGNLTVTKDAKGETLSVSYSTDQGQTWTAAPVDGNLSAVSTASGKIRFRANLSTVTPAISPVLTGLTFSYMVLLTPHHVHISPASSDIAVGRSMKFKGELHDLNNNTLNATFNWSSDIGSIDKNGNYTAPTEPGTATITLEIKNVTVTAQVNVLPGPLSKISIDPTSLVTNGGSETEFDARGFDGYGNQLSGLAFNWSSDVGSVEPATGNNTTFTAKVPPKGTTQNTTGTLTASLSGIVGSANITILGEAARVLKTIAISPKNATLASGDSLRFDAWGIDQLGDKMNLTFEWGSDVGTMAPSRGSSSTLTVTLSGSGAGNVTATLAEQTIKAPIKVIMNQTYPYPKIAARVPDQLKQEDDAPWSLDLNNFESGGKSDNDLTWHIEDLNTSLVQVEGEYDAPDILTFTLVKDQSGNDEALLVLQDKLGYRSTQPIWFNVTPVNDPPTLSTIPDLIIRYDSPYEFNYLPYVRDVDSPALSLSMSIDSVTPAGEPFAATQSGFKVTYSAPKSLVGKGFIVSLSVTDGTSTVKDLITVTVSDDWVPIIKLPLPDVTLMEGQKKLNIFNLDDHFSDKDKDVIYFSYGNNHVTITINTNHSVDMEASSEWAGSELVTFRATDSKGALVEDDTLVTVIPSNDAPVLDALPDLKVHYDSDYYFDLTPYISDIDTPADRLKLSFSRSEVWWAYDPVLLASRPPKQGTPRLSMVINLPMVFQGKVAPYSIELNVTVSDGYNTDTGTVRVKVSDDWPPNLNAPIPDVEFDEDTVRSNALRLTNYFSDPEAGGLNFTVRFRNLNVSIKPDGNVDFWAPENWNGHEAVTFRAIDIDGAIAEDTIIVTIRPINDPPVLSVLSDQTIDEKSILNLRLGPLIRDVDDDPSRLKIDVNTSSNDLTAFLSGTNAVLYAQKKGEFVVTVTVTDSFGASASRTFHLTVKALPGTKERPKTFFEIWAVPLLLLILITACLIGAIIAYRRYFGSYVVDDSFIILKDGRLISHLSRHPITKKDEQIFGSMVAATQMFVEDAFKNVDKSSGSTVQRMEFKGNNILIEQGKHMYLALMFSGTPGEKLGKDMKRVLHTIERKHDRHIADWDGDVTRFGDLPHYLMEFIPGGYTNPVHVTTDTTDKEVDEAEDLQKDDGPMDKPGKK